MFINEARGMYGIMRSTEYIMLQYVLCTCNEQDNNFVMNLTYDGAMGIIQEAGVQVTEYLEYEDDIDDFE